MNNQQTPSVADNGKTAAIVSYITIIGWLIAYFGMYNNNKTSFARYHLKQSLLLNIVWFAYGIAVYIIATILPYSMYSIISILQLVNIGFLILAVIGIITANNNQEKPLPLIGKHAEGMFQSL